MSDLVAALRDELLREPEPTGSRFFCPDRNCDGRPHGGWGKHARPEQRRPEGKDWRTWYLRGGRGSGKTRGASENFADLIVEYFDEEELGDYAIVAPTFGDARDTCVEGPSGLKYALPSKYLRGGNWDKAWNRSIGELHLANGSVVRIDGADDGAYRTQGKNLRVAWCDEVGLWRGAPAGGKKEKRPMWEIAWDESLSFALRLEPAQTIATGTPKVGHGLVKRLLKDPTVRSTHMRIWDNADNLAPNQLAELKTRHAGTRLGLQELEGEFIEEVDGALWQREQIEALSVADHPRLQRIVVAIDPAGSPSGTTGIVVAGAAHNGHAFVLADLSCTGSAQTWGQRAVDAYHEWQADRIVAEINYGGSMVEQVIRAVDDAVSYKTVTATRGKQLRAEPVSALYEQGLVHHVGFFGELVDQMCTWTPDAARSPDRMDALVWAITELLVTGRKGFDPAMFSPVSMEKQSYFRSAG